LTVSLTVSAIDATTRYPIALDFSFGDSVCPSGQYYNRLTGVCTLCLNYVNSLGTTTISGVCDCNTGFYWNKGTSVCVACVGVCPKKSSDDSNNSGSNNENHSGEVKDIINDFNSGNLRNSDRRG
jgi:hypothetical protein